jgi:hypothetical protein
MELIVAMLETKPDASLFSHSLQAAGAISALETLLIYRIPDSHWLSFVGVPDLFVHERRNPSSGIAEVAHPAPLVE